MEAERNDSLKVKKLISAGSQSSPSFLIPKPMPFQLYPASSSHLAGHRCWQATAVGCPEQMNPTRSEAGLPLFRALQGLQSHPVHSFEGPALETGNIKLVGVGVSNLW